MTRIHQHPHAEFDLFPLLVRDLTDEFGNEGINAIAERFVAAEQADFYWDGRIAEMKLAPLCEAFDDDDEPYERVAILGFFRSCYYVATCLVDESWRLCAMLRVRHFDDAASAESAFLTGD